MGVVAVAAACAGGAAGGAAGCAKEAPPLPRGVAVRVAQVEKSSTSSATRYSAQIVPATRLDFAFKVGGYVESIAQVSGTDGQRRLIQEGDVVENGMELAGLRKSDFTQKVAEAKAGVSQAYAIAREARLDASRDSKLARAGSLPEATAGASRSRAESSGAAVEGAQARLAQARTALADSTLVSPMHGVVIKRSIEVGTLVAPGSIAFTLADVDNVKAVFGVPDVLLKQIQLGAAQKVAADAFPGVEFEGKVSRLAPSADQRSRVFEVDVTIPNAEGKLKAGMVASLSINPAANSEADVPLIPLGAIVRPPSGKGFAVFVVENKDKVLRARAREVELGEYLGRVVPVKKGLEGGETIVVQGAGMLQDGERIEVIE